MNNPDNSLEVRAALLIDMNRYRDAIPLLLKAQKMDPENARLHCRLAIAYWQCNQIHEAHRSLDCAVIADPNYGWSFRLRSCLHRYEGRTFEAVGQALIAVNLNPESAYAYNTLADAYLATKEYSQAMTAAQRVLELDPNEVYAHNGMAEVHAALSNWTQSADSAKRALALDPENVAAQIHLGVSLFKQGKKVDAVDRFTDAVKLSPQNSKALQHIERAAIDYLLYLSFITMAMSVILGLVLIRCGWSVWVAGALGEGITAFIAVLLMRFAPRCIVSYYPSFQKAPVAAQETMVLSIRDNWISSVIMIVFMPLLLIVGCIVTGFGWDRPRR